MLIAENVKKCFYFVSILNQNENYVNYLTCLLWTVNESMNIETNSLWNRSFELIREIHEQSMDTYILCILHSFILIIFYLHDVLNVYTVWSSDCNSKYPALICISTNTQIRRGNYILCSFLEVRLVRCS